MPADRRCVFCRLPIRPGEPAIRCEPGFYPREDPEFFLPDDDVGEVTTVHKECFREAIGVE
jgi:hypothetical protein